MSVSACWREWELVRALVRALVSGLALVAELASGPVLKLEATWVAVGLRSWSWVVQPTCKRQSGR